jgi:hypothetical protein
LSNAARALCKRSMLPSRRCGEGGPNGFSERRFKDVDVLLNGATAYADARDQMSVARKKNSSSWPSRASASGPELPHIESQAIFCVSGLMKPLLKQGFDLALRGRPSDRGHAGIPAGSDFDVRRQAGGIHQALRVRYRPLVNDAIRVASVSTKPSSSLSGSDLFT